MSIERTVSSALHFHDFHPRMADFRAEVISGLSQVSKQLSPKYFYDRHGSELFDAITELPEYYPTRTEIGILQEHGDTIADLLGKNCLLLELGSGSSKKIRLLLDALKPEIYMPVDISREHLLGSAEALVADYPALEVHAVCADYTADFDLPCRPDPLSRVVFFPGSSIGNFEPSGAVDLLRRLAYHLEEGGRMLIGVDLKKDAELLRAAYNDSRQLTAAFNLNMLHRINRELDADFDVQAFSHHARYNEQEGRVEMHLVSNAVQAVAVAGQRFEFSAGETIHTENSYKYSIEEFRALAKSAGFVPEKVWTDDDKLFSVHCIRCIHD
ncbi:MAG: L-histidine N(alpha)-methyltransferase [Thiogranum sp.]